MGDVPDELSVAAVDLLDDLIDAGEEQTEDVCRPALKSFLHDRVVGVSEGLGDDLPGVVPAVTALVEADPHEFRNAEGRVRVVDVDGHLLRDAVDGLVVAQVALDDVLQGGGNEEVLLTKSQHLAFRMVVRGVEDLADGLGHCLLLDRTDVVALVEQAHVEARSVRFPQTKDGDALAVFAGDVHVIGDRDDRSGVRHLRGVVTILPAALDVATELDVEGLIGFRGEPYIAAGKPEVRKFGLPAVDDLLLEDAVLIKDAIAHGGVTAGGKAIQVAGCETAEAAVAEARVRFAFIKHVEGEAEVFQCFFGDLGEVHVVEVVLEGTSKKEFHAEVVDRLCVFGAVELVTEVVPLMSELVFAHDGNGLVVLLVSRLFRGDTENVSELGDDVFLELCFCHFVCHVVNHPLYMVDLFFIYLDI